MAQRLSLSLTGCFSSGGLAAHLTGLAASVASCSTCIHVCFFGNSEWLRPWRRDSDSLPLCLCEMGHCSGDAVQHSDTETQTWGGNTSRPGSTAGHDCWSSSSVFILSLHQMVEVYCSRATLAVALSATDISKNVLILIGKFHPASTKRRKHTHTGSFLMNSKSVL